MIEDLADFAVGCLVGALLRVLSDVAWSRLAPVVVEGETIVEGQAVVIEAERVIRRAS